MKKEDITDTMRIDFLITLAGNTIAEVFKFIKHTPENNANHYLHNPNLEARCLDLHRNLLGTWHLKIDNGQEMYDFEMVEVGAGNNLRNLLDSLIIEASDIKALVEKVRKENEPVPD